MNYFKRNKDNRATGLPLLTTDPREGEQGKIITTL